MTGSFTTRVLPTVVIMGSFQDQVWIISWGWLSISLHFTSLHRKSLQLHPAVPIAHFPVPAAPLQQLLSRTGICTTLFLQLLTPYLQCKHLFWMGTRCVCSCCGDFSVFQQVVFLMGCFFFLQVCLLSQFRRFFTKETEGMLCDLSFIAP